MAGLLGAEKWRPMVEKFKQSKVHGLLEWAFLRKSQVWVSGTSIVNLLNLFPEISGWRSWSGNKDELWSLSSKDILLVEGPSVDELWSLSSKCEASVICLSKKKLDPSLADLYVSEEELRSALLQLQNVRSQPENSGGYLADWTAQGRARRPCLFLDRDGVVLRFVDYLKNVKEVSLMEGISDLISKARSKNYCVVVVTNQSALGRGLMDWSTYDAITLKMQELLASNGVHLDAILTSPYFDSSNEISSLVEPSLRKPRPGMILSATKTFAIDLSRSVLVGDSATDLMLADLSGINRAYLFDSHDRVESELVKWQTWPLIGRSQWGTKIPVIRMLKEVEL